MSIQSEITRISDAKSTLSTWLTEQNVETEEGANLTSIANTISTLSLNNGSPIYYGTCSTSATSTNKVVACEGFTLETGAMITVKFTYAQEKDGTVTLNVNGTGAINICRAGSITTTRFFWSNGEVITFVYDGTNYVMVGKGVASTTYYGVTKLNSSVTSTSTSLAATSSAVKQAYDLAKTKQDALVSGTNIKTINGTSLLGSGDITIEAGGNSTGFTTLTDTDITLTDLDAGEYITENRVNINFYDGSGSLQTLSDLPATTYIRVAKGDYVANGMDTVTSVIDVWTGDTVYKFTQIFITSYGMGVGMVTEQAGTYNLKTINGTSLLGAGDITISGGGEQLTEISGAFSIGDLADGVYLIKQGAVANEQYTIQNDTIAQLITYGDYKDLFTLEGNTEYMSDGRPVNLRYRYNITEASVTGISTQDIFNCVTSSQLEPTAIELTGVNSSSSYECYYYPATKMVWFSMYVTGTAISAGTRLTVATVPEGYRPSRRVALAVDGLQDYAGVLKGSITSGGVIGLLSNVAKESGDDQYISGWWYVG